MSAQAPTERDDGAAFRERRIAAGMTQEQVAFTAGVAVRTVSMAENRADWSTMRYLTVACLNDALEEGLDA